VEAVLAVVAGAIGDPERSRLAEALPGALRSAAEVSG
jgi:hypothetical protein